MVVYYLCMLKNSIWKNGKLKPSIERQSDEQKLKTRAEAEQLFLSNVPEMMIKVVGVQTARQGTVKVFETLTESNTEQASPLHSPGKFHKRISSRTRKDQGIITIKTILIKNKTKC